MSKEIIIEIKDKDNNNFLTFDLVDIFDLLPYKFKDFNWKIYYIEVVGNISELGIDNLELEKKVEMSRDGYLVDWEFLYELSKFITQTINILLVSIKGKDRLEIECTDNSVWTIKTADASVIEIFKKHYHDVQCIS